MAAGRERGYRSGTRNGEAQAEGTRLAAGTGGVDLEDRSVGQRGRVVARALSVLLGRKTQAKSFVKAAAFLELRRVQDQ